MSTIKLRGLQHKMTFYATGVPVFPNTQFGFGYPEAIGDAARSVWFGRGAEPTWEHRERGVLFGSGKLEGELEYTITATARADTVDAVFTLTNLSDRKWQDTISFNCFQLGGDNDLLDFECVRHYVGQDGSPKKLMEVPRVFGPRPAVQLYSVAGAPPGRDLPFVANFRGTPPETTLEGWMAIMATDGQRLVATVSKPAMFLFQNMEYSCIHSASGFGPLAPGETGRCLNRSYFVESTIEAWYDRMKKEMAPEPY